MGNVTSSVMSIAKGFSKVNSPIVSTPISRFKNIFSHGINYSTTSEMAQFAKNKFVGNLPNDLLNIIIKNNPNRKRESIRLIQDTFVDTACVLQQCEKLQMQGMRRNRLSLDNAVKILDNLQKGKTDFYKDKIFNEKITELTLKAENMLMRSLKSVLPDVHNVKLTFIGNGAYGDAFKLEVLNKQGQKVVADNVIKTFKSDDAQSKLLTDIINKLFTSYSVDDIANQAQKMGINLDKGNISALKNQMQDISNSFNAESCASVRRLHGSFAEANSAEYIRKFAGHKLDETQGLVLPNMFYLGDIQFSLSKFLNSSANAIREFNFQRLGLRHTDESVANRINGVCFDIGGIVPYLSISKLRSFDTMFNSNIAGNKTAIKILKRIYNTKPEQREQMLATISREAEQCKNMIERQHMQKAIKEIQENYSLVQFKTNETEVVVKDIPSNILNALDNVFA